MMKKTKAYFQILIILTSIFTIYLLNPISVSAQPSNFCCERTVNGDFCKYTSVSECDNNYQAVPTSCSYTSFCKTGCCVIDGACSSNLPKSACENNNGQWTSGSCDNIAECDVGCCVIGNDYTFTTEAKCKKLHQPFPGLSLQFRKDIVNEQACLEQSVSTQEGCCKIDEETFSYGSRAECLEITGDSNSFYNGLLCSNPQIGSTCQPKAKKGCFQGSDDVYWFDSCGNPEGAAQQCDYDTGTICGEQNNAFTCISTDCNDPKYGNKKNGESWCEYEQDTKGIDWVGARHYRRACIEGKIIYEDCADFREEVCIQGSTGGKTEARCVKNDGEPIPVGGRFWDGINSCGRASDTEKFKEGTDPQPWIDAKAIECTQQGDCGNYQNAIGVYSEGGYTNSCGEESDDAKNEGEKKDSGALGGLVTQIGGGVASAVISGALTTGITLGAIASAAIVPVIGLLLGGLFAAGVIGGKKTFTCVATCSTWQPPTQSACERCTDDPTKTCSEYKCRSLGQNCGIVNENTPFVECTTISKNDAVAPSISPLATVLTEGFTLSGTTHGYKINEGVKAYTPIKIGIRTNEPAQCKMSVTRAKPYKDMEAYFGSNLYLRDHELSLSIPKELLTEGVLKETDNKFVLYTKCQDASGNANDVDYQIDISVLPGPDLTPPFVEVTEPDNNIQLPTHITEQELKIYLNEPSECKYSPTLDVAYDQMPFTFNCASSFENITPIGYGLYECNTKLTGIRHDQDTNYWIRCRDQPLEPDLTKRNTNSQSFIYSIKATEPLEIVEKGPEGDVYTNAPTLFVKTAGGSDGGNAQCGFTEFITKPYIKMFKTGFTEHEQTLKSLERRRHTYHLQCIDSVGNIAKDKLEFNVAVDVFLPIIESIVTQTNYVTLTLNEKATCEYANASFTYGSGTGMQADKNATVHNLPIEDVLYVACRDSSGNDVTFTLYT